MSAHFARFLSRLYRNNLISPKPRQATLRCEAMEDRTVPTTVTVSMIQNADESGTDGLVRFHRDGNTSNPLTVMYSVGGAGTATVEDDYEPLDGEGLITIPANESTVDLDVVPIGDAIWDPNETVIVSVAGGGMDYDIGTPSSATVTIADDVDAVETRIHQETFSLTGSSTSVDVTLVVTYNAPGAPGVYTWTYTVTNPSPSTIDWTSFSIPVEDMDDDVGNLSSSLGWAGTAGSTSVGWAVGSGTPLHPNTSATFSFTTDPREVGAATITISDGTVTADLPTAPAPRVVDQVPMVLIEFQTSLNIYKLTLRATVPGDNAVYSTGQITFNRTDVNESITISRDLLFDYLEANGWVVKKVGDAGLTIRGKTIDGAVKSLKTLTYEYSDAVTVPGSRPTFTPLGQITVGPY